MKFCRTCKSNNLRLFLELGNNPLAQGFLTGAQIKEAEFKPSLNVYYCEDCVLIQVHDNIPKDFFTHYLYVTSTSDQLIDHFNTFAQLLMDQYLSVENRRVVDLGSGDGVLLHACKELGADPIGIDPAVNLADVARGKGLNIYNEYFTPDLAKLIVTERGRVNAVVTSNTFNIIDDLDSVVEGVKILLDDDGVFILEVQRINDLLENNQFDTINHEHLSQFSVHSLMALFKRHSMELICVDPFSLHGGSMRVFVQPCGGKRNISPNVNEALNNEIKAGLFRKNTYFSFYERIKNNKKETISLLNRLKSEGKSVACYGAAGKSTTMLNYYGIGPDLVDFIADRNEMKHGLYSPGMHIPVTSTAKVLQTQPDYLLVLAWNFADEIMQQQREYKARGGKFIIPIPFCKIV